MENSLRINTEQWRYLNKDTQIQKIINDLQQLLNSDRVVVYTFNSEQIGQVTFEALSSRKFSILNTTKVDDCFNSEYIKLYQDRRIRVMNDVNLELIQQCHRIFLQELNVRANLIVPILKGIKLAGLLVVHHCQSPHHWNLDEIIVTELAVTTLVSLL